MSYDQAMPDWLILSGVQAGSGHTETFIASVEEATARLSPETLAVLSEERFITNPPDSFLEAMPGAAHNLPTHAVLMKREGHLEASFDTSSDVRPVDGLNDHEAVAAMAELNAALTLVKREVLIAPGTSVIFNNRRVVHGRGAVRSEENFGLRRWIQRLYVYDPTRLTSLAMGYPGRAIQLGGGLVRLATLSDHPERILELASQ
jgi:alpha-ketoglutarate-dependent taurine dioxygenase